MPYVLGIDLGSSYIKATIRRAHRSGIGRAESLMLGAKSDAVPSVLHLDVDGSVLVGEEAEDSGPAERDRVARGFVQRIGDQVPFVLGGKAYTAQELFAAVISWIAEQAAYEVGGAPEHIAVTQPAGWSRHHLNLLRPAMDRAGLRGVTFVPELTAAALDYAVERPVDIGDVIAVCDLGGSACRAAVLRRSGTAGFEPLAPPERVESPPGTDPGEAVLAHVRSELGSGLDQTDLVAPGAWQAALTLRRECTAALETLMSGAQAAIPVSLPDMRTTVGMTRRQLEDAVRPAAREAAELLGRVVRAAGVHPWSLSAVVLVGGSAQVPLVSQVISTELRRPAAVAANPKATMARGAAVAAMQVVWPDSVSIVAAPGRELGRSGVPGKVSGVTLIPRPRGGVTVDETVVLFPEDCPAGARPDPVPDLDELADEMPPRPPLELTPLPFDVGHEPVSEQPMWKRIALGGGVVGGIVLVLALVGWFVFGSPLHSTSGQQPVNGSPMLATPLSSRPAASMRGSRAPNSAGDSPDSNSSRTTANSEDLP